MVVEILCQFQYKRFSDNGSSHIILQIHSFCKIIFLLTLIGEHYTSGSNILATSLVVVLLGVNTEHVLLLLKDRYSSTIIP